MASLHARRSRWRAAVQRTGTDAGVSLIEVMVAILLIALVVTPAALFLDQAVRATGQEHLRLEASNLASKTLEDLEADAANGQLPTASTSSSVAINDGSHVTDFTVVTNFQTVTQGTNQNICTSGAGPAQQIWLVSASVSWPGMGTALAVVQTTEIAPAQAGAIQQSAGELAVRLSTDGTQTDLFTAFPPGVNVTVTGTYGPGGSHTIPPGTTDDPASQNSGNSGCVVFQNLDTTTGMTYEVTLTGNPTLVTDQEYSSSNPNGSLSIGPITLQPGTPNIQSVTINLGTTVAIAYTGPVVGPAGTCPKLLPTALAAPITPSPIPISVENSFLTSYPNDIWDAYSASSPLTSLLLFPWPSTTQMYAGDQPDSAPSSVYGTSGPAACAVDDTDGGLLGGTVNVYLPLYPLPVSISGTPAPTSLTATEVAGGSRTFTLNGTPPYGTTSPSATSLPLGEYSLSDQNGSLAPNPFVWVTPSGECAGSGVASSPPAGCTASTLTVAA
jgi:Tfp pilus assembly protein PilV